MPRYSFAVRQVETRKNLLAQGPTDRNPGQDDLVSRVVTLFAVGRRPCSVGGTTVPPTSSSATESRDERDRPGPPCAGAGHLDRWTDDGRAGRQHLIEPCKLLHLAVAPLGAGEVGRPQPGRVAELAPLRADQRV